MKTSKKHKNADLKSNFLKYAKIEKEIKQEIQMENEDEYYSDNFLFNKPKHRKDPIFAESVGAVSLYSQNELCYLYNNVRRIFGDEKERIIKEIIEDLSFKRNRRNLAGAPAECEIEKLRINYPNFSHVIDQISYAASLSKLAKEKWFQMPPLLLLGPPGVGKTSFAQAFAEILGVYFNRIDVGTLTTGSSIAGLSFSWSTGAPGEIFKAINESQTANPLIMLDEIDKFSGSFQYPIEPVLLSLLEKESAKNFKDEAMKLQLNCKYFLWIATANDLSLMSEPLKSRFNIVHVEKPSDTQMEKVVRNIYEKLKLANPWGYHFKNDLKDEVVKKLKEYNPRELNKVIQIGFGKAAARGGNDLIISDIEIKEKESVKINRIGFI